MKTKSEKIAFISKQLENGQIFESDSMKMMITDLSESSVVLTVLSSTLRKSVTKTFVSKNGETFEKPVVDNTPVLTDSTRRFARDTFSHMIHNKIFSPTRLARWEKFLDLNYLEVNRMMVKQSVSLR